MNKQKGAVLLIGAVLTPVLVVMMAVIVDIAYMSFIKTKLQAAADASALACVSVSSYSTETTSPCTATSGGVVVPSNGGTPVANIKAAQNSLAPLVPVVGTPFVDSISVTYPAPSCPGFDKCADATAVKAYEPLLIGYFLTAEDGQEHSVSLTASARAGNGKNCLLALDQTGAANQSDIRIVGNALLKGGDCTFHSNNLITATSNSTLTTKVMTCSETVTNTNSLPCGYRAPVEDPFAGLTAPAVPSVNVSCTANNPSTGICTCSPGKLKNNYLGNCNNASQTEIRLKGGLYYLENGVTISKKVRLVDDLVPPYPLKMGVTFYAPPDANYGFSITGTADHNLRGPSQAEVTSNLALYGGTTSATGMLIWKRGGDVTLAGGSLATFAGNIYVRNGELNLTGTSDAEVSPGYVPECAPTCTEYGSIVARNVKIVGGSSLQFVTNYDGTRSSVNNVRLLR